MCNLNVFIRNDKFTPKGYLGFIMATTSNSYAANSDGEGFYFSDGLLVKDYDKVDVTKYKDNVAKSRIVLSHQRLATHGFSKENVQPFASDDFVLAHNGVMTDFVKNKEYSDTHGFFTDFCEKFKNIENGTRQEKIIKAVKELLDKKGGSWSIVLYDKLEDSLYYFKESGTNINLYKHKNFAYITTKDQNKLFLPMLGLVKGDYGEIKLEAYNIYKICIGNKIKVYKVGEIEKKTYYTPAINSDYWRRDYDDYGYHWYSGKSNYANFKDEKPEIPEKITIGTVEEKVSGGCEIKECSKVIKIDNTPNPSNFKCVPCPSQMPYVLEVYESKLEGECIHCGEKTKFREVDEFFICEDCITREQFMGAEVYLMEDCWGDEEEMSAMELAEQKVLKSIINEG